MGTGIRFIGKSLLYLAGFAHEKMIKASHFRIVNAIFYERE